MSANFDIFAYGSPVPPEGERTRASATILLHSFAAVAVPILLRDVESVRAWMLWTFVGVELFLAALDLVGALGPARIRRFLAHHYRNVFARTAGATNLGLLAWLGPDMASNEPGNWVLLIALMATTAMVPIWAAFMPSRTRWFLVSIGIVGGSYLVAFIVAAAPFHAAWTALWCGLMLKFSTVGFTAIRQLRTMQALSERTARRDNLTGLLTRAALFQKLQESVENTSTDKALVLIDLDGFKGINDAYGHAAGDRVLEVIADRLMQALPPDTPVGRLGGDEFAALVDQHGLDLQVTLDNLITEVGRVIEVDGRGLYVAGSVGWTYVRHGTPAEHMAEADAAMYQSKNSASSTSTGFDPLMRDALTKALERRHRFRAAIKQQKIEFLAQPIVRATDGVGVAVEILARWPSHDPDTIGPDEFNRLADETGLAIELDTLALTAAKRLLDSFKHDPYLSSIIVKCNISPLHLHNLELARTLDNVVPPNDRDRLGLELVESRLVTASQRHHGLLRELKAMGVTISIDDFGTGYSSLAYLRSLPVSEIKIDRQFVSGIDTDPINQGLVRTIVDLAATLGVWTVAEGVETVAEHEAVASLGVGSVQGFHTSAAVPFDEVADILSQTLAAAEAKLA